MENPDYKNMFKAANERNDEYIFQYQYTDEEGMGSLLGRTLVSDPSQLNGSNGMTEIWGTKRYTNNYIGEHVKLFAVPQGELERNPNLTQNPGW